MEPQACVGKENVAWSTNENSVAKGDTCWRAKAIAALSQLSSLQQRASAAELKACELQLVVDQATLTAQALDDENSKVRAMLAAVQDERDRLILMSKLRSAKTAGTVGHMNRVQDDDVEVAEVALTCQTCVSRSLESRQEPCQPALANRDDPHDQLRATIEDLTSQLQTLRLAQEEAKLENETLLHTQHRLQDHIDALQDRIAKLQDENDYFSIFHEEDVLLQEEDGNAVYGGNDREAELRVQLNDGESELCKTLERSNELRAQSEGQIEDISTVREQLKATKGELSALKEVHGDTLSKLLAVQLQLHAVQHEI